MSKKKEVCERWAENAKQQQQQQQKIKTDFCRHYRQLYH